MRLKNVYQVWWYNASTLPRRELPPISLLRSTRGRRTAVQHTEGRQKRRRLNACGCNLFSPTVTSPRTIPCLNHTSMYGTYRQATSSRQKPTPSQRPRGAHAFPERAVLDGHACGQPGGKAAEQLHGSSRFTQTLQSYTFYLCSPPPAQTVRLSGGGVGDQFPEAVKSGSVSGRWRSEGRLVGDFREDSHWSSATGQFSISRYWLRQHMSDFAIGPRGPACRTGTNHAARRRYREAIGSAGTAFRLCTAYA